ncbi:hypothetical protein L218DRAFT_314738 [Marasmius fiardii PR-910]|nr:hypothetical protein L218DRAFT_314738 [Marasmius fiardii PR-910]
MPFQITSRIAEACHPTGEETQLKEKGVQSGEWCSGLESRRGYEVVTKTIAVLHSPLLQPVSDVEVTDNQFKSRLSSSHDPPRSKNAIPSTTYLPFHPKTPRISTFISLRPPNLSAFRGFWCLDIGLSESLAS